MSITCRSCQSPNPEGTSYCIVCGDELPQSSSTQETANVGTASTISSVSDESNIIDIPALEVVTQEPIYETDSDDFDLSTLPGIPTFDAPEATSPIPTDNPPELESTTPLETQDQTGIFLIAKQPNMGSFLLEKESVAIVGRFDPDTGPVDIDLDDYVGNETVSRQHAEIYFESGTWKVKDLGSTNGVFIRRAQERRFEPRITAPSVINSSDEIAFGKIRFNLQQK